MKNIKKQKHIFPLINFLYFLFLGIENSSWKQKQMGLKVRIWIIDLVWHASSDSSLVYGKEKARKEKQIQFAMLPKSSLIFMYVEH